VKETGFLYNSYQMKTAFLLVHKEELEVWKARALTRMWSCHIFFLPSLQ